MSGSTAIYPSNVTTKGNDNLKQDRHNSSSESYKSSQSSASSSSSLPSQELFKSSQIVIRIVSHRHRHRYRHNHNHQETWGMMDNTVVITMVVTIIPIITLVITRVFTIIHPKNLVITRDSHPAIHSVGNSSCQSVS